ncbi:hypothetical protein HDV05_006609 [Chytridiales sp. JEL 0842]|nr:hypothetical protein HDV05_006609 [Chytridiales sp. JEL 0842]
MRLPPTTSSTFQAPTSLPKLKLQHIKHLQPLPLISPTTAAKSLFSFDSGPLPSPGPGGHFFGPSNVVETASRVSLLPNSGGSTPADSEWRDPGVDYIMGSFMDSLKRLTPTDPYDPSSPFPLPPNAGLQHPAMPTPVVPSSAMVIQTQSPAMGSNSNTPPLTVITNPTPGHPSHMQHFIANHPQSASSHSGGSPYTPSSHFRPLVSASPATPTSGIHTPNPLKRKAASASPQVGSGVAKRSPHPLSNPYTGPHSANSIQQQMAPPHSASPSPNGLQGGAGVVFHCTVANCRKAFAKHSSLQSHLSTAHHISGSNLLQSSPLLPNSHLNPSNAATPTSSLSTTPSSSFSHPPTSLPKTPLESETATHTPSGTRKPHQCTLCPQTFSRSHDLKRHYYIHTQSKPYACPRCMKSFARRDALRRHERAVVEGKKVHCHAVRGWRPYAGSILESWVDGERDVEGGLVSEERLRGMVGDGTAGGGGVALAAEEDA